MSAREQPFSSAERGRLAPATTRWVTASVVLSAALGQFGFLRAALHGAPVGDRPRVIACAAVLALLPWLEAWQTERGAMRRARRAMGVHEVWRRTGALAAAVALLFVLALPAEVRIHGLAIVAGSAFAARRTHDVVAALALAFGPCGVMTAVTLAPSLDVLVALPLAVVAACVGCVLVHGRATLRRARVRGGALEARPRLVVGVGLAAALLVAAVPFLAGIGAAREAFGRRASGSATLEADAARGVDPERERERRGDGERRTQPGAGPEQLEFGPGRGISLVSEAEVLSVRSATASAEEVLYLRHIVLDHFGPSGVTARDRSAPRTRRDADDGLTDGWVRLQAGHPSADIVRLDVETLPLQLADRPWTLLPLPSDVTAVALEPVRYSADGPSVFDGLREGPLRYACETAARPISGAELRRSATEPHSDELQLPAPTRAMARIAALARRVTSGARSDLDRVLAVVEHLQQFDYSLEDTSFNGIEALAEFAEQRRGYCTYFASTAALMLRAVGVPARVAVGFLARRVTGEDEPPSGAAWVARERDAHAWLEVRFEGYGWLTFDPTPSVGRAGGVLGGWSPLTDEPRAASGPTTWLGRWQRSLDDALARYRGGDGDLVSALLAAVLAAPGALVLALALGLALAAALRAWWRIRGPGQPSSGAGAAASARRATPRDLHARIGETLRRGGQPRPPGRTLAQHAGQVVAHGHAPNLLPELVRLAYRERFGPGLDRAEVELAERLTSELAERVSGGNTG